MPFLTVIVPVYNAGEYIEKCVCSLIEQTLHDLEIILVNDCSTDDSLSLLKHFAAHDTRIKVFDMPKNGGVAAARNAGLTAAQGVFVAFVDNDDWVDTDRYEKLCTLARQYNADSVLDGFFRDRGGGSTPQKQPLTDTIRFLSGQEMIKEMFTGKTRALTPWHGIYKRSIAQGLRFQPIRGEDVVFNFEYYARAAHVCLLPGCSYHFRELAVSQSRGYLPPEAIYSLKGTEAAAAYLKNNETLRVLVPDFDLLADAHLLGEYATIARNTCEKDCPQSFAQRREFLGAIAASKYFRSSYENKAARAKLGGRKRRFLSLLYSGRLDLLTTYMFLKGIWKKALRRH